MGHFKRPATILLFLLGVVMIVLGIRSGILPPPITGAGFILIAVVFLSEPKKA